ncbi:MAG: putative lipid II flippase FtsW [Cyanobacteria bacterium NC_groundwater_1444_Ag_S-0.65um_54_12]|nr:putative lipid II flippase FtsW [Cyanobacteria bacterium NC_groundwater_1444_Ag_S-0.65um_54_12]
MVNRPGISNRTAPGIKPAERSVRVRWDSTLLLIVLTLALLGFLMILSASAPAAQLYLSDSLFFFKKHFLWGLVGIAAMALGANLAIDRLKVLARPILVLSAALLVATYLPDLGVAKLGAARWLHLGPFSFQPSEFAKVALVIYLADILSRKQHQGWTFQDFRQALLPVGGTLGLVMFQPDLGTTLILAASAATMLLCAGTSPFILFACSTFAGLGAAFHVSHTAYQRDRFLAFLDPWAHAKGIGFQIIQSLLAIGSGGILGTGWGQGKQKLFYLPIQHTDFIFAVLAEELGLIGTIGVVLLFLIFAQRGFAIARHGRGMHAQLMAVGLTSSIVFQAFLNIAVVTAAVPTTGVPLPLLSFGGTSLVMTFFAVGLLLSISRTVPVRKRSEIC